mmetsp:Transcript_26905/g.71035  ORF Transcript_26905/g.71035 Transcript_26905/m.71035 type:complete len:213 (-) Transcript_26905:1132-1770(-)
MPHREPRPGSPLPAADASAHHPADLVAGVVPAPRPELRGRRPPRGVHRVPQEPDQDLQAHLFGRRSDGLSICTGVHCAVGPAVVGGAADGGGGRPLPLQGGGGDHQGRRQASPGERPPGHELRAAPRVRGPDQSGALGHPAGADRAVCPIWSDLRCPPGLVPQVRAPGPRGVCWQAGHPLERHARRDKSVPVLFKIHQVCEEADCPPRGADL